MNICIADCSIMGTAVWQTNVTIYGLYKYAA